MATHHGISISLNPLLIKGLCMYNTTIPSANQRLTIKINAMQLLVFYNVIIKYRNRKSSKLSPHNIKLINDFKEEIMWLIIEQMSSENSIDKE